MGVPKVLTHARYYLAGCVWLAGLFTFALSAQSAKKTATQLPPLDFPQMMQPIPASAAFHDPGYFVWCGTMIRSDDGKYHLYYSRWKKSDGFESWVTRSEVAHAIGASPSGPFVFHDLAFPARGKQFWDGLVTHNPTIQRYGSKYYLYYTGDTGDGLVMPTLNWSHRNNQRIGVAVADSPNGPWKRFNRPIIDVSADSNAPDSLCVGNPSITRGRDGKFELLYKAVGRKNPLPFGGPVVHLMAVSDSPTGPFHKDLKPMFTVAGSAFPFEDPFFWYDTKRDLYFVIMKDNHGIISGTGRSSLVLYQSKDAADWVKAEHLLVSDLRLNWKDRPEEPVQRVERPQLTFDANGYPIALVVAIYNNGNDTYNVRIPLSRENDFASSGERKQD
jgi:hypothetical protein